MLATPESQVDPRHTAVVVVDVQNDFCAAGGVLHKRGVQSIAASVAAGASPMANV